MFSYQCVLVAVVNHPSFLNGCAGATGRLSDRLHHPHQWDVNTEAEESGVNVTPDVDVSLSFTLEHVCVCVCVKSGSYF